MAVATPSFDVGMRKNVELDKANYWLMIKAKAAPPEEDAGGGKMKFNTMSLVSLYIKLINLAYWKYMIILSVYVNIILIISYFWLLPSFGNNSPSLLLLIHLLCLLYWIDFIGAVIEKVVSKKFAINLKTRGTAFLFVDAVSLLPLSVMYLLLVKSINFSLLWKLRAITVVRFYRIPLFFLEHSRTKTSHWILLVCMSVGYVVLVVISFANMFLSCTSDYTEIKIKDWNETVGGRIVVSLYYTLETMLNIGNGDIMPLAYGQMLLNAFLMIIGTVMSNGILSGIISIALTNIGAKREYYRYEYEAIKNTLSQRKFDKKMTRDILHRMNTMWKYKKVNKVSSSSIFILPLSLRREIYFDINFVHLNRSLIFSRQPRWFLRSVALFMKNLTYLPGEVILEPSVSDGMICVASGVIEVLSEENDESVLCSLTTGTIIGEATLFISLPIRCFIRASTYVELQVLMKVDFTRLALTYQEIFRKMRGEIFNRLRLKEQHLEDLPDTVRDSPGQIRRKRRETKNFLQSLKNVNQKAEEARSPILSLYTLSENIPRVKTLPINLIRERPWILRPYTPLKTFWNWLSLVIIIFVAISYPILVAFYRKIDSAVFLALFVTKAYYFVDVYLECTTAIERNDHFTYITSIREIIGYKLKSFGFYLDVLSMYYLSIYSNLLWPENPDYANLILSMNALLKTWRVTSFLKKLEDEMKNRLLFLVTVKYLLWIAFFITWGAALLYVEACPGDTYVEERWYNQLEVQGAETKRPRMATPAAVSFYYATVATFSLGYGDIVPKAIPDCVANIICMLAGYVLMIACVSETSAALKHLARIRTNYQEELFAIKRFMTEHDIPKDFQKRVKNYLSVQWIYDKGYSLKHISESEILPGLQRRIIMLDLSKTFLTVPLFRNVNPEFLKVLSQLCKVRVLPPGEIIIEKDRFLRHMYIIENGYCEVTRDDEKAIIGPLTPFGYVEMILGKPQQLAAITLTHVRMVSLNYSSYLQAVTKFPEIKLGIENFFSNSNFNDVDEIFASSSLVDFDSNKSQIYQKLVFKKAFINLYKYHKTIPIGYWESFQNWGKWRFLQILFMPISIHPGCFFLKVWMALRIISALSIATLAPVQFSLLEATHNYMKIITFLQVFAAIDMYLMFHVAYYDKKGLLMFHPSKTATHYIKSNFIPDLIAVFPYYWILAYIFSPEEGSIKFIVNSSGLIMILQLYKFFQACYYFERDIMRKTNVLKILKLFPFVLIVINFVTGLVILIQCYKLQSTNVSELQGSTQLAREFEKGMKRFCLKTPTNKTEEESVYKMYLVAFYWVTATITVCGFGDIWAHNQTLMMFVIVIVIFGIFFFTFVFSSITGSLVNTNTLISQYRKKVLKMKRFMKKKNVPPELQKRLTLHYQYNWERTEGQSPQKIFAYVNSGLRETLVSSMYEQTISQNPIFENLEKMIVSIIGRHLQEMYFLQGETIIKYKDVQEHIYVIYRGEVHLRSPDGQFIASMGSGGIFGNITNKSFSLSTETVLAAENVDIIKLDRKVFFTELKSYPDTQRFIKFLTTRKENYIRPRRISEGYEINTLMKINIFRIPSVPVQNMGSTSTHVYRISGFTFKKSVFFIRYKPCATFVILPNTVLHNVIEMLVLFMAYISVNLTVYLLAFQDSSLVILILLYILDLLFIFEMYLQFHMTIPEKFGECSVNREIIRKRYYKSKKLYYDIVSNIPLEIFALAAKSRDWQFKCLTILRLNRILRLHFIFEFYHKRQKKLMTNKIYLKTGWTLLMFGLMIHSLACVWFLAVCPLGFFQTPTWVTILNLKGKKSWEYYIYSVYHVIIVTSSTGLQALPLYSVPEVMLEIILMVACRYVVVLLSALMAATISADNYNLFIFQELITEFKETFRRQNISPYQLDKMWNYLCSLWNSEIGKQMPEFLETLPYAMKCEVMNEMFGIHLSQSYIFSGMDQTFLRQLAVHLKRFLYFPGTYIVQQGDIDYTMYFIHSGEVSVLTIHPELIETIHFTLTEKDMFGTKQGLIIGKPHSFSYRAETNVEILSLTLRDWQGLLKYFPAEAKKMNDKLESLPD